MEDEGMGEVYMSEALERLVEAEELRRKAIRWATLTPEQRAAESPASAAIQAVFRGKRPFKVRFAESRRQAAAPAGESHDG